jgi:hypothetical protein
MQQKGSGISKEQKILGFSIKKNNFTLVAYSDANFAGYIDDRTSTSWYLLNMCSTIVSWSCKKQATMENYSAKA